MKAGRGKILGVVVLLMTIYVFVVIGNPHVKPEERTVFIRNDLGGITDVYGKKEGNIQRGTEKGNEKYLKCLFEEPVSEVIFILNSSVLDKQPNRLRLNISLFSNASLTVKVTVVKVVAPTKNDTTGKYYSFSQNESGTITIRVWSLKERNEQMNSSNTFNDSIKMKITEPNHPGEGESGILGLRLYNFRYIYYTEGKRGKKMVLGGKEYGLFFLPFVLTVFLPFVVWLWKERANVKN